VFYFIDGAKVAAGISASSSSCYDNSLTCTSRAVDGNFSKFNYFKSKEEVGQWLKLNLSQVYHIFRVQVTSHQRKGTCTLMSKVDSLLPYALYSLYL